MSLVNPARQELAGFGFVCRMCNRLHERLDAGQVGCGERCGGPLAGMDYPMYRGALEGALAAFCFVCGAEATCGIQVGGKIQAVGCCDRHLSYMREMRLDHGRTR